jgi:hypothetical protein
LGRRWGASRQAGGPAIFTRNDETKAERRRTATRAAMLPDTSDANDALGVPPFGFSTFNQRSTEKHLPVFVFRG